MKSVTISTALFVVLSRSNLLAVTLPESPKPQSHTVTYSLVAADLAVRELDAWTTAKGLENPRNCEAILPDIISKHPARLYLYGAAVVSAEFVVVHKLEKHHKRLARLIPLIDIAVDLPAVINNARQF